MGFNSVFKGLTFIVILFTTGNIFDCIDLLPFNIRHRLMHFV